MFNPSRDEVRTFFIEARAKHRDRRPLVGLEATAADIIAMHPEYHALLDHPGEDIGRSFAPAEGMMNPFLHLSLHLALEEQLSIDQPAGIRGEFARLQARCGDRHAALHEALECLGETVWAAQRNQAPPDAAAYLDCLRRR